MPLSPIDCFISYSHANSALADRTEEALKSAGYSVWLDRRRIEAGRLWRRQLRRGLDRCATVVVLLSPESVRSPYVAYEYRFALRRHKRVIPLLMQPCEPPARLQRLDPLDFTADFAAAFAALRARLPEPLPRIEPAAPRSYPTPEDLADRGMPTVDRRTALISVSVMVAVLLLFIAVFARLRPPGGSSGVLGTSPTRGPSQSTPTGATPGRTPLASPAPATTPGGTPAPQQAGAPTATSLPPPLPTPTPVPNTTVYAITYDQGDGELYALDIATHQLRWKQPVRAPEGFIRPIMDGGILYYYDAAYRATDGALVWQTATRLYNPGSPVLAGPDIVLFANTSSTNTPAYAIVALARADGSIQWQIPLTNPSFTSAVTDGTTVYTSGDGNLLAITIASGAIRWKMPYPVAGGPVAPGPVLANGILYLGLQTGFAAIRAADGALLWQKSGPSGVSGNGALVQNGTVYVVSCQTYGAGGGVYALDAASGDIQWQYSSSCPSDIPDTANGVLYYGDQSGTVTALRLSDHTVLWTHPTGAPIEDSPTVFNGVVYVGADDGNISALDSGTGALVWSYAATGKFFVSPVIGP